VVSKFYITHPPDPLPLEREGGGKSKRGYTVLNWFRNLKKWQKGGLIGCAVGLVIACIIILSPYSLQRLIESFHDMCYWLPSIIAFFFGSESHAAHNIIEYGGRAVIVIFYGVLGALFGRFQQIANPSRKWLLTALLALFLLGFYVIGYATY
jgi:hypothetical protein